MEGQNIDSRGVTNAYRIRSVDPSPFLVEALKARGIEVEYKAVPEEEGSSQWDLWTEPQAQIMLVLLLTPIVLQILCLRAVRRLQKTKT
jgi:hypothetical protein